MANCSTAIGTVTISSDTEEHVEEIVKEINDNLSGYNYYTEVFEPSGYSEETEDGIKKTFSFEGCGRWTYSYNIENFGRWMNEDSTIKNIDWKITFDYSDVETGCDVLYSAIETLRHEAGQRLSDVSVVSEYIQGYEINRENLTLLGFDADYFMEYIEECENIWGIEKI